MERSSYYGDMVAKFLDAVDVGCQLGAFYTLPSDAPCCKISGKILDLVENEIDQA